MKRTLAITVVYLSLSGNLALACLTLPQVFGVNGLNGKLAQVPLKIKQMNRSPANILMDTDVISYDPKLKQWCVREQKEIENSATQCNSSQFANTPEILDKDKSVPAIVTAKGNSLFVFPTKTGDDDLLQKCKNSKELDSKSCNDVKDLKASYLKFTSYVSDDQKLNVMDIETINPDGTSKKSTITSDGPAALHYRSIGMGSSDEGCSEKAIDMTQTSLVTVTCKCEFRSSKSIEPLSAGNLQGAGK